MQPKNVRKYLDKYLRSWAIKGVTGHFVGHDDELLPPYLHVDSAGAEALAPLVGASPKEVALMGTLTGNLHLLLTSFYRPTAERYKIIIEGKAFPSDHVSISIGSHFRKRVQSCPNSFHRTLLNLRFNYIILTLVRLWSLSSLKTPKGQPSARNRS